MSVKENLVHSRFPDRRASEESRRYQRIQLQVPLFVRGRDAYGEQFLELAKTLNISAQGALLTCQRSMVMTRNYHAYAFPHRRLHPPHWYPQEWPLFRLE